MSRSCMCFGSGKRGNSDEDKDSKKKDSSGGSRLNTGSSNQQNKAIVFTYEQLVAATDNFKSTNFIGKGGFGSVYKGKLEDTDQVIAVKHPGRGVKKVINDEFFREIRMLSNMHHPNLIQLIGYCAEADKNLLVYEYMPLGSLLDHIHGLKPDSKILNWNTRMKIAVGAAKGLQHLHDGVTPPVIHRDLKAANILLGEQFHPKISDFGIATFIPADQSHVSVTPICTPGYCDPAFMATGRVTKQSDIYSFGVVLLELITGRLAVIVGHVYESLADWARPRIEDKKNISQLADPLLNGQFPESMLSKYLNVAYKCIHRDPIARPPIHAVVLALEELVAHQYNG